MFRPRQVIIRLVERFKRNVQIALLEMRSNLWQSIFTISVFVVKKFEPEYKIKDELYKTVKTKMVAPVSED